MKDIDQSLRTPASPPAASNTLSVQVPLGIMEPKPIVAKLPIATFEILQAATALLGLYCPVNGAVPVLIELGARSVKMVLVKLSPLPPLPLANVSTFTPGGKRYILKSPTKG